MSTRRREKSRGSLSALVAAVCAVPSLVPVGASGPGGGGGLGPRGYWRRPCLCGARRGCALNCALDLQRAGARPPPFLPDPIFCTVAGSCRIVAGQLPDSCRLFFTQLPSFWLEKSKFCKINPFSNQNGGNCVKNRRQLSGNWPATIRQLPAIVQNIGSTKRGGPPFAWLAPPLRLAL